MTAKELERIYSMSAVVGHTEACAALFLHGYFLGRGLDIYPEKPEGLIAGLPAPSRIVAFSKPELR